MTLTEFLLARIAEDEDRAKRAAFGWGESWSSNTDDGENWSAVYAGVQYLFGHEDVDLMDYIARHEPARVLAECEAKRQLIERVGNPNWAGFNILALPYAEHPDYRPEWRP